MDRIYITMGDFLKNAGIVGLFYAVEKTGYIRDKDYGITEDKQAMWIDRRIALEADWTDIYFKAFINAFGLDTAYQSVIDKIDSLVSVDSQKEWGSKEYKDDLKYIEDKLLASSYKSGYESIKNRIDNPEIYEKLNVFKLKNFAEKKELLDYLRELKQFLLQPLCRETFCMKSIIYNQINRFWTGVCFLNKNNKTKDMKEVFENDFTEPLKKYLAQDKKMQKKDMCIDCGEPIAAKEKVSIAFMVDQADDLTRKRSSFWDFKVDAYLCPVCAFVYALSPLGFRVYGDKFFFVNINTSLEVLLKYNEIKSEGRKENEKYTSWIARTINLLLEEKSKCEIKNVQVITRGKNENERYTFDIINKDLLSILNEEKIKEKLERLSEHPYIKTSNAYLNVHETVMMNLLRYRNQYALIDDIFRICLDTDKYLSVASNVYDIQLRVSVMQKYDNIIGGAIMNRYGLREKGYELRNEMLRSKGTADDACIRGTVYQLINALAVCDTSRFMDICLRIYSSTNLQIPDAFIKLLGNKEEFREYGYAFVLGLKGSHYVKKEEIDNE